MDLLKTYLAPVFRWWWLVLLAPTLAAVTSYLVVQAEPQLFQSRTTIMIGRTIEDPNPNSGQIFLSQQLAQTYADIARREPVRNATMDALGLSWLPDYNVRPLPNTQILEVTVVDTDPRRAQAVAAELTNQLIQLSPSGLNPEEEERQNFINQQLADLQTQIRATQDEITDNQTRLGDLVSAREIAEMQNQINALQGKLNTLQSNYAALLANTQRGAVNTLTVIEPASLPGRPLGSNRLLTIASSAAVALSLAVGAAYVLEFLDNTVKIPPEAEKAADLPLLATIGRYSGDEDSDSMLVTLWHSRSPAAESFRVLRTGIHFSTFEDRERVVLLTSPGPGDGKSVTAANLAVVMAQAGHRVLLVDADMRRPTQHELLQLKNNMGLSTLFLHELIQPRDAEEIEVTVEQLEPAIQPTRQPGLYLMPSGPRPPNPSELLGSSRMGAILEKLAGDYDYIIIDSPPCLYVTDALVLSRKATSVVLLARAGVTRQSDLRKATQQLKAVNAQLHGVILNAVPGRADAYGYYYLSGYEDRPMYRDRSRTPRPTRLLNALLSWRRPSPEDPA